MEELLRLSCLRWLQGIDLDITSKTYGVADREYWAWKTKDYANGTHQAGLAGFLDTQNLLELNEQQVRSVIKAVLYGTKKIQRSNGSFEEAYPLESSYAVTGLVLFNILYSFFAHKDLFDDEDTAIIEHVTKKAVSFIERTPETHGVISNHICTSTLAIDLAKRFLQEDDNKTEILKFLILQDKEEGWFPEYGLADPGYQTLLNHYLVAWVSLGFASEQEKTALAKSAEFISKFCMPSGDFAGEIGSRGTSIFYPSGLINGQHWFEEKHIRRYSCVSPVVVDHGNFVPVFNSWSLFKKVKGTIKTEQFIKHGLYLFKKAGLLVNIKSDSYLVLSMNNGTLKALNKDSNGTWIDKSISSFHKANRFTQLGRAKTRWIEDKKLIVNLCYGKKRQKQNNILSSIILRFISLVSYYFPPTQRIAKKILAKVVMTTKLRTKDSGIKLEIELEQNKITISNQNRWKILRAGFYSHMASANTFDPGRLE